MLRYTSQTPADIAGGITAKVCDRATIVLTSVRMGMTVRAEPDRTRAPLWDDADRTAYADHLWHLREQYAG